MKSYSVSAESVLLVIDEVFCLDQHLSLQLLFCSCMRLFHCGIIVCPRMSPNVFLLQDSVENCQFSFFVRKILWNLLYEMQHRGLLSMGNQPNEFFCDNHHIQAQFLLENILYDVSVLQWIDCSNHR